MMFNPNPPSRLDPFLPRQADDPDQSPIARSLFANRKAGIGAFLVVGIIVLLAVMAFRDAGPLFTQGDAETSVVRQLCADEISQSYAPVYEMLSSWYRQNVLQENQAAFVETLQQRDQRYGPVQKCSVASRDIPGTVFSFGGAVLQVSVTLGDGMTHTGPLTLVNNGGWKIDQFDLALHLDG
jgi:hypothetical protein